jgi:hypothetical protein
LLDPETLRGPSRAPRSQEAAGSVLAFDGRRQLADRVAELRVSVSDSKEVAPGGHSAQVGRGGVETTPHVAGTATPRARPKLIGRLARGSAMWRPLEAGGVGRSAGVGLDVRGL